LSAEIFTKNRSLSQAQRLPLKGVSLGLIASLLGVLLPWAGAEAALCPAQLIPQIDALLNQPPLDTAYIGMLLQTQAAGRQHRRTLYERNRDRTFTPASNVKLLTTAAALHRLGSNYRLRTSVYGTPGPGGLTVLRVLGRGDPTVTEAQITSLAQQVQQAGVTQVSRLVVDDSYFPGFATNPTWEWEDAQFAYAAPVNGLILNQNAVAIQIAPTQLGQPLAITGFQALPAGPWPLVNDSLTIAPEAQGVPLALWRTGDNPTLRLTGQMAVDAAPRPYRLAVLNPAQQFAAALQQALAAQGMAVGPGAITQIPASTPGPELAAVDSPPLADLLIPANRDSDNLYAEVLFKTLAVVFSETTPTEASQAGGAAVKAVLAELGVPTEPLRLADGSGLSRHNLVTPTALVETLQVMAIHPEAQVFRDSLAVAGVSGTLRNRLVNTSLAGRVQGKSGALTGNVALSGYVHPPNYEPLVFSLMINHSNQHASILRAKIDAVLQLIAQLSDQCEG
jgi:serine-type D-Ala-D-Ala carboxypeptidase/endopeptidase (penicillin-binding protein 4)